MNLLVYVCGHRAACIGRECAAGRTMSNGEACAAARLVCGKSRVVDVRSAASGSIGSAFRRRAAGRFAHPDRSSQNRRDTVARPRHDPRHHDRSAAAGGGVRAARAASLYRHHGNPDRSGRPPRRGQRSLTVNADKRHGAAANRQPSPRTDVGRRAAPRRRKPGTRPRSGIRRQAVAAARRRGCRTRGARPA